MKKFSVPCDFNGVKSPFTIYIGFAKPDHHPIHFQADWLSKERGGTVPSEVMDSLSKLRELADQNGVSFEELCTYALGAAQQAKVEAQSDSEDSSAEVVENNEWNSNASDSEDSSTDIVDDNEDNSSASNSNITTAGDDAALDEEEDENGIKKKK